MRKRSGDRLLIIYTSHNHRSHNYQEMDNMHVEFSCELRMSPSSLTLHEIVLSGCKVL